MKPNIKDLSLPELEGRLGQLGQPSYRAKQIWQWLFHKRATSFGEMTNLSASLRATLDKEFSINRLKIVRKTESLDGTVKFLFGLADGENIESVLIPETKRLTLCISTQAGCGFGCAFCATAVLGLKRNLRASEILDQIMEVSRTLPPHPSFSLEGTGQNTEDADRLADRRITHVVLMGMGEPLANYQQTLRALQVMTDTSWGLGFSSRRVTLSTVGLVPQIRKLMDESQINLAISLHAANDRVRGELMPINRKYSLEELMDCCRSLPIPRRKRITFEYVLLHGVNDSVEDARQLCRLLEGIRCKINLIPFNPHPESRFQRPSASDVERFQQVLHDHGVQINVRRPRGDDIQAACGQLQGEEFRHRQTVQAATAR
jgi:23S rRNA (adenine2503-C2)-methyltransferase